MEKKELQEVFDIWQYNYIFDPETYLISEETKAKIEEEGDKAKDTQFEFVNQIVEEISKLKDQAATISRNPKLKSGVLVFNLVNQNKSKTLKIKESTERLGKIITEDKKQLAEWCTDKLNSELK